MIRAAAEGVGWIFIALIVLKLAGCIELAIYISSPRPTVNVIQTAQAIRVNGRLLTLDSFKQEAWQLSHTQPYTHSQALEALAKQYGFKTYAALRAALKEPQA